MSIYGNTEFLFEVSKGNVPEHAPVHKFGRNGAVPNGSAADIQTIGGIRHWPTAAQTITLVSADANDTLAGSGARTVTLEGLDANWDLLSETVNMNGVTPVASTGTFIRLNRAFVEDAGTYASTTAGSNAGLISITWTTDTNGAGEILVATGIPLAQTQLSNFSIPLGKKGYIFEVNLFVETNKPATVLMFQRQEADDSTAPVKAKRLLLIMDGVEGNEFIQFSAPIVIPEKTDIWFSGVGNGVATSVTVHYTLVINN